MKKFLIGLVIFIALIALLPIIGNSVADGVLKDRVSVLTSNGLELKNATTDISYLNTKKHYEFLLSDAPKFVEYLNQYSNTQVPPYVDALLEGVVVGVDIEHSNFPLSSKILVDIYPLSLSTQMSQELKEEDIKFYEYLENFLQSKGLLYHINYYISDELFDGYVKNIDEEYLFDNGSKLSAKLSNATYYGSGSLVAPKSLQTNITNIFLEAKENQQSAVFEMQDIASSFKFDSFSSYVSDASMRSMNISIKEELSSKIEVTLDDFKIELSSNTQGKKAEFKMKNSLESFKLDSSDINLQAKGFNYNVSLDDVDKDSYEEFLELSSQTNVASSPDFEKKVQDVVIKLLSKGLSLRVADISIDKIVYDKKSSIDGFSFIARMTLNEDASLAQNIKSSPKNVANNINLASTLTLSKEFYALINKNVPLTNIASTLAKEKDNKLIFELKLNAGVLSINDKMMN
jgi:hypothetical protein